MTIVIRTTRYDATNSLLFLVYGECRTKWIAGAFFVASSCKQQREKIMYATLMRSISAGSKTLVLIIKTFYFVVDQSDHTHIVMLRGILSNLSLDLLECSPYMYID